MNLRPTMPSRRPPPRWRLLLIAALALVLLSFGRAPGDAGAALSDYASTLYLSNTAASVTGSYRLVTSAPSGPAFLSKNRIPLAPGAGNTGYQDFQPNFNPNSFNTPAPMAIASTTPNNKGWMVDGSGAVSFAGGTWTFTTNVTAGATTGLPLPSASLAVGMWKVTTAGNAISSSTLLIDPSCSARCGSGAAPGDLNPSVELHRPDATSGGTAVTFSLAGHRAAA